MPNLLFRIELFRRAGFTIWSSAWYGGHTTPGYSVLLAPLGAIAGPGLVGAASAVVAAVCFDLLLRTVPDIVRSRAGAASLLFAAGTVVNLAIGRLAFALGLALGLAALAARRRHRGLALVLSVATPLGSPVAGVFLLLAWLAVAIHARHRRRRWPAHWCSPRPPWPPSPSSAARSRRPGASRSGWPRGHPAMPEGAPPTSSRGCTCSAPVKRRRKAPRVQLLGSGTILREVIAAADLLQDRLGRRRRHLGLPELHRARARRHARRRARTCCTRRRSRSARTSRRVPRRTRRAR